MASQKVRRSSGTILGCLIAGFGGVWLLILAVVVVLVFALRGRQPSKTLAEGPGEPLPGRTVLKEAYDPGGTREYRAGDAVLVRIPARATQSPATLEIRAVKDPPPMSFMGLVGGPVYEIILGDQFRFDVPLTIELEVDRSKWAGSKVERPLAAYWDTREKVWQIEDVAFDAERGVAVIETRHLTAFRLVYVALGSGVIESDHFSVVFEPKSYPLLSGKQTDAPVVAEKVLKALGEARDRFMKAGFRVPRSRTWAFLDPNTYESYRDTFTLHITLKNGPFANDDDLAHEVSHEYFHAVQNQYFDVYGMHVRRWWMDATAEYAATVGAGTDVHMDAGVNGTWFTKPLATRDKELHEYVASAFVRHLVRENVSFPELFHATTRFNSVAITSATLLIDTQAHVLTPIEWHVQEVSKRSLLDHYEHFARLSLFSQEGPVGAPAPYQWCAKNQRLAAGDDALNVHVDLEPGYTAKALCAEVAEPSRAFAVRLRAAVPGTLARAYVVPLTARSPSVLPVGTLSATTPVVLAPAPGQGVAVMLANGSSSVAELEVIIEATDAQPEEEPLPSVPGLVLFDPPRPYRSRTGIYIRASNVTNEGSIVCGTLPTGATFDALGETKNGYVLLKITDEQWRLRAKKRCTYAFAASRYVEAR